jgi:hypothetical protein
VPKRRGSECGIRVKRRKLNFRTNFNRRGRKQSEVEFFQKRSFTLFIPVSALNVVSVRQDERKEKVNGIFDDYVT